MKRPFYREKQALSSKIVSYIIGQLLSDITSRSAFETMKDIPHPANDGAPPEAHLSQDQG